jgi:N-acetylneuraminic acid mutarotase
MAVAAVNGILYAIGGESEDTIQGVPTGHVVSSVEAYDPATDTWTARASLPVPVASSTATVVDGIIYLIGGGPFSYTGSINVYAYDPAKDKWTVEPPMPTERYNATASALNGVVYVIGGYGSGGALSSVIALRP